MGEDCVDNKNSDQPLGTGTGHISTVSDYNITNYGSGSTYWDGDTYVCKSHYGDPDTIMKKKINTILERIEVIERTLLAVLDELRQLKEKDEE